MTDLVTISANPWLLVAFLAVVALWRLAPIFYRSTEKTGLPSSAGHKTLRPSKRAARRQRR